MRVRAYVVDDEPLAIKRLVKLLGATGRVDLAGSTTDPEEALAYLAREPVDVVFLDISMPGMTGFQVLARLPAQPLVVFTTAHDQYALQAFEVNAIDYLVKPIEAARLDRALAKVERLRSLPAAELRAELAKLVERLGGGAAAGHRIASRVGARVQMLELPDVSHFFAEDKLTWAAVRGKTFAVDPSIAELEARFAGAGFLRIHRSTLVNLAWVDSFSEGLVRLKDGKTELAVARDRVRALKDRLGL